MQEGRIIKGIGGFYYIKSGKDIIECKARGKFRKEKITPLVGDRVIIDLDNNNKGIIKTILSRKNELIRPPVANISQIIIVFAVKNPDPNMILLDKFLVYAESLGVKIIICFNKVDLISDDVRNEIYNKYSNSTYEIIFASSKLNFGIESILKYLENQITVFAGPSGVGKTSLLNKINPLLNLETGKLSNKINRGKHTTRHVELFEYKKEGFVVDTPGFSTLDILDIEERELMNYFPEFNEYKDMCKFNSCLHEKEPNCAIKEAVLQNKINTSRYESYIKLLIDIREKNKYKRWDKK